MFVPKTTAEIVITCIATFFIVVIALLIILLCIEFFYKRPRRRAIFREIAEALGSSFSSKSDMDLEIEMYASGAWDRLTSFNFGLRNRKIKNVINNIAISCGKMTVFDYHGQRNGRYSREPSFFPFVCTCALVNCPEGAEFPYSIIRPSDYTSKLSYKMFGEIDPGLENYPEFAQKYRLILPNYEDEDYYPDNYDERLDVIEKRLIPAVVKSIGEKKDLTIYFNRSWIVYCSRAGGIEPEELESFIAEAKDTIQNVYSAMRH